jgi:putative ABC transport system ATP-binding protein
MTRTTMTPVSAAAARLTPIVAADRVVKTYGSGDSAVRALRGVSVALAPAQFTAIMGASGSGKSTFLHCLAGLDTVTSGTVRIADADITKLSPANLTRLRRERLGFVFQAYNLLPMLTVSENITLVAKLSGRGVDRAWFGALVTTLGLGDRLRSRPAQLSGGQQQRVAVARALLTRPDVIFADEPTGNLDSKASEGVLRSLRAAVDSYRQAVVMVTHDPVAASYADRLLFLADGGIVDELAHPTADMILGRMSGMR